MLDARQLEALNAVIEHGGFGPAAKSLSITLAAVSLRIKSLEDTLGQRLLVRGKQVRATPAGQALLGHVKQVRLMEADLLDGLQGGAPPRMAEAAATSRRPARRRRPRCSARSVASSGVAAAAARGRARQAASTASSTERTAPLSMVMM